MLTGHEVDNDEVPKIIILFNIFPRNKSSKLHYFFSSLFLSKCMKHLVLYTMNICNIPCMWDNLYEEKFEFA
jgi:hypothetical protein